MSDLKTVFTYRIEYDPTWRKWFWTLRYNEVGSNVVAIGYSRSEHRAKRRAYLAAVADVKIQKAKVSYTHSFEVAV